MKTLLIVLPTLLVITSFAQSKTESPQLPIDELTKLINYTEIVQLDTSFTKNDLYLRGREWFAKAYSSSKNVIQLDEKESGKIVAKALMPVYHKSMGTNYPSGYINYTITISFKDGRYKYEVSNFYHTGQNSIPDYGFCEAMINTTRKTLGFSYQKTFDYYLHQMDNNINNLIGNLKTSMNAITTSKNDDW